MTNKYDYVIIQERKERGRRIMRKINEAVRDTFQGRILEERKKKGWTQRQAAKAIGLSQARYAQIEAANNNTPTFEVIERFGKLYGFSIYDILIPVYGEPKGVCKFAKSCPFYKEGEEAEDGDRLQGSGEGSSN